MLPAEKSLWSDRLQQLTREAIETLPVTHDGNLHFKHGTLGHAYATLLDLMDDRLILHSKSDQIKYTFDGTDALLEAGWALD